MNESKRPRPYNSSLSTQKDVIVISDSDHEEPPRKKHKPTTNDHRKVVASTSKTPEKPKQDNNQILRKKKSPFKNPPQWLKENSSLRHSPPVFSVSATSEDDNNDNDVDGDEPDILALWSGPIKPKKSAGWTNKDNNLLRHLSIDSGKPKPDLPKTSKAKAQAHYSNQDSNGSASKIEEEAEQILNQFKLPSTVALKFNTSGGSRSIAEAKAKPDSSQIWGHTGSKSHNIQSGPAHTLLVHPSTQPQQKFSVKNAPDPRSIIEVRVPQRSMPSLPPQTSSTLSTGLMNQGPINLTPAKLQQPQKFQIQIPLSEQARYKQERKSLQQKLKEGTQYAKDHPDEVQRLLGMTGFSTKFPADLDEKKLKKGAQPKKRIINRSQVGLDLSDRSNTLSKRKSAADPIHPQEQANAILTARFQEHFDAPLTFSNTVNDRRLNGKFQFISESILRKGIKITGPIGRPGCTCIGRCDLACLCLEKTFKGEKTKHERTEKVSQYERRPDGLVVLRDDFIKRYTINTDMLANNTSTAMTLEQRVEISECGEHCPCDDSCINRVVQKGRTVPLEIFETNRCGFGVRSSSNLVRGQFIEFYLGEVITANELDKREDAAEAGSTSYIYSLDWFSSHQPYHIDGENFGSAMRFVNHSCDPNTGTFTVLNNKSTKQLHHVAFFAIKDIPADTEITIDYTPQAAGTTYELNTADEGMEKCYCGAENCRQMLWLPGKERKARKKTIGRVFD